MGGGGGEEGECQIFAKEGNSCQKIGREGTTAVTAQHSKVINILGVEDRLRCLAAASHI